MFLALEAAWRDSSDLVSVVVSHDEEAVRVFAFLCVFFSIDDVDVGDAGLWLVDCLPALIEVIKLL